MQDRPEAPELLEAVGEFLFADVREWAPREKRFVVLVAANVCAILARELRAGDEPSGADLELFRSMLGAEGDQPTSDDIDTEARETARELARRIREGAFDADVEKAASRLQEHVRRKLHVARPGYWREGD